jgi:hypothetical protein
MPREGLANVNFNTSDNSKELTYVACSSRILRLRYPDGRHNHPLPAHNVYMDKNLQRTRLTILAVWVISWSF